MHVIQRGGGGEPGDKAIILYMTLSLIRLVIMTCILRTMSLNLVEKPESDTPSLQAKI